MFTVVRGPAKKFKIQGADGSWRLPKNGKGLLYRLPEVIEADEEGRPIAIVEGEKDADRLRSLGIAATCNAMGAGKWTKGHVKCLPAGCKVVVMGDADWPGLAHITKVATTCQAAGHETLILPPKAFGFEIEQDHGKDVSDWLDKNHGADELQGMGSKALTVERWLAATQQPPLHDESRAQAESKDKVEYGFLAREILRRHADKLLIADDGRYGVCYTLDKRGIWQTGERWWITRLSEVARYLVAQVEAGSLDRTFGRSVQRVLKHHNAVDQVRRHLGGILDDLRNQGEELAVVECDVEDLDSNMRYLGAANGVVDLHTGELLTPEEARKALVTISAPTEFHRDARHEDVDRLFFHLPKETAEWWWDVLAYHLHGAPSRRVYLAVGPSKGGKTTLITALTGTLGPYAGHPTGDALMAKRMASAGLSPELEVFTAPRRFALIDEISTRQISIPQLKNLSGDGLVTFRLLHQQLQTRPATATIIIFCNEGSEPHLRLQDEAMADRLRVLPYPEVPAAKRDPDLKNRVKTREFQVALLAELVRRGRKQIHGFPPENVAQITEATEDRVVEDKGEIGAFATRIRPGSDGDLLAFEELWEAWCDDNGESNTREDRVGGIHRQKFTQVLRQYIPGLPAPKTVRFEDGPKKGWRGWRLDEP